MHSSFTLFRRNFIAIILLLGVSACSPHWNWREIRSDDAPVSILLPAKPTSHAGEIDLNGNKVTMFMTATEVNGVSFAIGSIAIEDTTKHADALMTMQTAMVRNINGEIRTQKPVKLEGGITAHEIVASGRIGNASMPVIMAARFASKGKWVVQAVAVGPEKNLPQEVIETFLGSLILR
jgi:hypothetical protein